ncbi:MAG: Helix-turn-helix domain [Bacteroidota bacterium]|jgi:excisionase family DNA binding protein
MQIEEFISVRDLAKLLKLDRQAVQKWAREDKIPCLKVGVGKRITYRFNKEEILEFFKNRRVEDLNS